MAPSDNLNNQSKGKSARSTSKINNKTDFQFKKQRLSDLRKEKLSKPKTATQKSRPSFSNLNETKFHLSLSKLHQMDAAYFARILLHRVLMTPAIWNYGRDALTVSLLNGTIMLHLQTLVLHLISIFNQKYHCPTKMNQH
jgi:hypothetical protein